MPQPVTVVVASRDRPGPLRRCVAALLDQRPPGACAVVVVDDGLGSVDPEIAALAEAGRLRVLRSGGRGPAAARNAGIAAAGTPIVAVTDDDCVAPPDWAARLAARLEASPAAVAVGGRVVAPAEASLAARVSQALTHGFTAAVNVDVQDAGFLTSNNVAYRRAALEAAGAFDESFTTPGGEERELHARLRGHGRLLYAPDVVVEHRADLGWWGFVRQQVAYGRGARSYYRRRAAAGSRPRPFALGTYLRAFAEAFRVLAPRERPALAVGIPLSQAAVAWGYWRGR